MNENIGKEILKNPRDFVVIANKEQLLDTYPEWFEKVNIDSIPFFLEKKYQKHTKEAHRYIITPSGLIRIYGEKENIWGISEENKDILVKLDIYAKEEDIKMREGKYINDNAKRFIEIDNTTIDPIFIPYGNTDITRDALLEMETNHSYETKDIE